VDTLQLADHPGRLEPGTGGVDFRRILGFAMAHRFSGLVELEHHWSKETSEAEANGLAALRILERQARAMNQNSRC
jgi:hydroxypyruvate isomerase